MNGLLIVNKPKGFTSFDCVALLRRVSGERHIGHTGTLDPNATGVLPVCLGTACRLIEFMDTSAKKYLVCARFGFTSDTLDVWGAVEKCNSCAFPSLEELQNALSSFVGEIDQVPPMYAAIKVNGKRLYQYAREGKTLEVKPRKVTVYSCDLLNYQVSDGIFTAEITCSRGTYIRSITRDLGDKFGCGCIMTDLTRLSAAGYELNDCHDMEVLRTMTPEQIEESLLPLETAVNCLPKIALTPQQAKLFYHGNPLFSKDIIPPSSAEFCACFAEDLLLGISRVDQGKLKAYKVFH